MLRTELNTRGLTAFRRAFSPKEFNAAQKRAVQGETFRLFTVQRDTLRSGLGYKGPAPLTRVMRRSSRRAPALATFSRLLGFKVKERPGGVEGLTGHSTFRARKKANQPSLGRIEANYAGFTHIMDKDKRDQLILRALRKTTGRARSAARSRATTTRGLSKRQKKNLSKRIAMLPAIGTVIRTPKRPVMDNIEKQEAGNSPRNMAALFEIAISGQKWAREWWW